MSNKSIYQKQGENIFAKTHKVSSELLTLTYGAYVSKLIKDTDNVEEVNAILDKMGYNIGSRVIDEYFAKSPQSGLCHDFKETADVIANQAFKMFLGVTAQVTNFDQDKKAFTLLIPENPLSDFVILPLQYQKLWYSNILCGVIRGSLDMLNMKVNAFFVKDTLRGQESNEIRVQLKEIVKDKYEDDD